MLALQTIWKEECLGISIKKWKVSLKSTDFNLLIYFEIFQYVNDAIKREKNIKKWKRQWKINLIEEENPDWEDLAKEWDYFR